MSGVLAKTNFWLCNKHLTILQLVEWTITSKF
jgi:hypothetical protein